MKQWKMVRGPPWFKNRMNSQDSASVSLENQHDLVHATTHVRVVLSYTLDQPKPQHQPEKQLLRYEKHVYIYIVCVCVCVLSFVQYPVSFGWLHFPD